MDPRQARVALIQFALWGVALTAVGGSIAAATFPYADPLTRPPGDEAGFWFGVVIAWAGTLLLLVPVVAWGAKLGRQAWPASEARAGDPRAPTAKP